MIWSQKLGHKERRHRLGQKMRLAWRPSVSNDHENKVLPFYVVDVVYGHYISVFMWSTNHIMCATWLSDVINTDM